MFVIPAQIAFSMRCKPLCRVMLNRLMGVWFAGAVLSLGILGNVQAQMVPRAHHALHQSTTNDLTEAQFHWANDADVTSAGKGLNLNGRSLWPSIEGRVGVLMDRPVNPLSDRFMLAQSAPHGLSLRSVHVLSDYYVAGGFRATAGMVRGEVTQAWWSDSGDHGGTLNLSVQRIDSLNLANTAGRGLMPAQTTPYVGAGYSTPLALRGAASAWRFNADIGFIADNATSINRVGLVLQGDKTVDELMRDLRLKPIVKMAVGYSF